MNNLPQIKTGQFLTLEQMNSLTASIKPKYGECQYRKGRYGHTITRKFAGYVFMRAVHESRYEVIITP